MLRNDELCSLNLFRLLKSVKHLVNVFRLSLHDNDLKTTLFGVRMELCFHKRLKFMDDLDHLGSGAVVMNQEKDTSDFSGNHVLFSFLLKIPECQTNEIASSSCFEVLLECYR